MSKLIVSQNLRPILGRRMCHYVMVSLWCESLLTLDFSFFKNEQLLSSNVTSRKRASKCLRINGCCLEAVFFFPSFFFFCYSYLHLPSFKDRVSQNDYINFA